MNNNENNTNDGFGKGLTLIIIGVVALFVTFFDFEINWHVMVQLWPMLLILIGVCIMPINKWIRTVLALMLIAFGVAAYQIKADGKKDIDKTEIISRFYDDDDDF